MTDLQRLELRAGEIRKRLAEIGGMADLTDETRGELATLRKDYIDCEDQQSALKIAGDTPPEPLEQRNDAEGREFRELRSNAQFGRYVAAAMGGHGVGNGAELELNQHLGIADNYFPFEMLAGGLEQRAARDGEADTSQGTWLDRVFQGTAAESVGVSFRPVAAGVSAYPVTTVGGTPI